jgi:oligopeptide/dipeptide ABC transporter ATP-binding protein
MVASALASAPLLDVRDLRVSYAGEPAPVAAVDGVSFAIAPGEVVCLLGESGSGKTTLALSLAGLAPDSARRVGGSIRWRGEELADLSERRLQAIRGAEIGFVFQEPGIALHPLMRVGDQIADVLRAHAPLPRARALSEAERLIAEVGLEEPARIGGAYPHELSGGQQQRVTIAQAIACRPALIVADEPTASLDTTTRAEILALLQDLNRRLGLALLLVTHDLATVATLGARSLVMYAGRVVEDAPFQRVARLPLHPYTQALLACRPRSADQAVDRRLPTIGGTPPDLARPLVGCAFEPRCPDRMAVCRERQPPPVEPEPMHVVRCFKHGE